MGSVCCDSRRYHHGLKNSLHFLLGICFWLGSSLSTSTSSWSQIRWICTRSLFSIYNVPKHKVYEWGYKRGNKDHFREEYLSQKDHTFKAKLKWGDSYDGHGEMYYDYNHAPKHAAEPYHAPKPAYKPAGRR